jgi:hypothetical protein
VLSDVSYFKAANVPAQMLQVTTTELAMQFDVNWVAPDAGSLPIDGYIIEFLANDGTFKQTDECDGFDPIILNNLFCTVNIDTMTTHPFNID